MLRVALNSGLLTAVSKPLQNQSIRWIRKPRKPFWMLTAKSKLFRVPDRKPLPTEENEEMKRLYNNYRTSIKSIRRFLTYRYSVLLQAKSDTEQLKKAFEEDFARCSHINDQWNQEINKQREERLSKQLEFELQYAEKRKAELSRQIEQELSLAEEIVQKEKAAVANFVTIENLDEVIEKAINNPVDYNFAVDVNGKTYGKEIQLEEVAKVKI